MSEAAERVAAALEWIAQSHTTVCIHCAQPITWAERTNKCKKCKRIWNKKEPPPEVAEE